MTKVNSSLFQAYKNLDGGQLISIPKYTNKHGAVTNYRINGFVNYPKLCKNDLKKLNEAPMTAIYEVSAINQIPVDIVQTALEELSKAMATRIESQEYEDNRNKLIAEGKPVPAEDEATAKKFARSRAQANAFINLGKGLKMHKETMQLHITGLVAHKEVLIEGEYPTVNSRPKTIAKKQLEKVLKLQTTKYRSFIVENCEFVNMSGTTIDS